MLKVTKHYLTFLNRKEFPILKKKNYKEFKNYLILVYFKKLNLSNENGILGLNNFIVKCQHLVQKASSTIKTFYYEFDSIFTNFLFHFHKIVTFLYSLQVPRTSHLHFLHIKQQLCLRSPLWHFKTNTSVHSIG